MTRTDFDDIVRPTAIVANVVKFLGMSYDLNVVEDCPRVFHNS